VTRGGPICTKTPMRSSSMKRNYIRLAVLAAFIALSSAGRLDAQFAIPLQTLVFGSTESTSSDFVLNGYLGANLNPVSRGPNFRVGSGFWSSFASSTETVSIEHDAFNVPQYFHLETNYPNPFNPSTKIVYGVPRVSQVRLSIINSVGQEITVLVDRELAPGTYQATWDASNTSGESLPSGIYFYHLSSSEYSETRKMVFLK